MGKISDSKPEECGSNPCALAKICTVSSMVEDTTTGWWYASLAKAGRL